MRRTRRRCRKPKSAPPLTGTAPVTLCSRRKPSKKQDEDEDEDEDEDDEEEDEEEDLDQMNGEQLLARARGEVAMSSSDEEESEEEEEEEVRAGGDAITLAASVHAPVQEEGEEEEVIEYDEATAILGAFNMDWDQVHALPLPRKDDRQCLQVDGTDIMAVLQSFVPAGGAIQNVAVHATKEGAETLEKERTSGPQVPVTCMATVCGPSLVSPGPL